MFIHELLKGHVGSQKQKKLHAGLPVSFQLRLKHLSLGVLIWYDTMEPFAIYMRCIQLCLIWESGACATLTKDCTLIPTTISSKPNMVLGSFGKRLRSQSSFGVLTRSKWAPRIDTNGLTLQLFGCTMHLVEASKGILCNGIRLPIIVFPALMDCITGPRLPARCSWLHQKGILTHSSSNSVVQAEALWQHSRREASWWVQAELRLAACLTE